MAFTPVKAIWAGAFAISLATLPLALSASAQTAPGTTTTVPDSTSGTTTAPGNTSGAMSSQGTDATRDDRGFDWGWLGLLGLAGLAGLTRKHEQPQVYRDPNESARPTSRM